MGLPTDPEERRKAIEAEAAKPVQYPPDRTPWSDQRLKADRYRTYPGGKAPKTPLKKKIQKDQAEIQAKALEQ